MKDDVKAYLERALASFDGDPPDTEFQCGYEDALKVVYEDLFMTTEQRRVARAERQKRMVTKTRKRAR